MATNVPALPREQLLPAAVNTLIRSLMPDLRKLLPADLDYEKFRAGLWLELTGQKQLKDCSLDSIRSCAIKAATYGLLPGKYCNFIPFRNKGRLEATFIPNYFGLILTLERTGKFARAFAHPVYEGDEFTFDYFADEYHHIPYTVRHTEPGKILFYYGAVKLKDGTCHVEPMSLEDIDAHRKRAPARDDGPWVTDTVAMARKTAMRNCTKYVHLTPEEQQVFEEDQPPAPPERPQRPPGDMFGDPTREPIDVTPTPPEDSLWRDTVAAHWQDMPDPLREQCRAALEDLETPRATWETLADQVLAWLDAQPEQAG